ncbi:hypothetical protein [Streptomyces nanshensis]|uniref:Uncharacterized protein n=1 Tax=Streptomyces nanshensis TaxID=518642 RepID=A0A1E7KZB7_9ACTN|nr:hypothetical protein [Streptomyces nanshensis]OEV09269.1 hypothetical protein AN218_22715 [Streptomyces nanshensis]
MENVLDETMENLLEVAQAGARAVLAVYVRAEFIGQESAEMWVEHVVPTRIDEIQEKARRGLSAEEVTRTFRGMQEELREQVHPSVPGRPVGEAWTAMFFAVWDALRPYYVPAGTSAAQPHDTPPETDGHTTTGTRSTP